MTWMNIAYAALEHVAEYGATFLFFIAVNCCERLGR
jgi:hypothetical protein